MQRYWFGNLLDHMGENEIFVFGSNPEGRHGLGAAKLAVGFGAQYGRGRGLYGNTYGLITKNLKAGFTERLVGGGVKHYPKAGIRSVSLEEITQNVLELYNCATSHPELEFYVIYQDVNKSLNGYSPAELFETFVAGAIPDNLYFHVSFKDRFDAWYAQRRGSQSVG